MKIYLNCAQGLSNGEAAFVIKGERFEGSDFVFVLVEGCMERGKLFSDLQKKSIEKCCASVRLEWRWMGSDEFVQSPNWGIWHSSRLGYVCLVFHYGIYILHEVHK